MNPEDMSRIFFEELEGEKPPAHRRVYDELPTLERRVIVQIFARILMELHNERRTTPDEQIIVPYRVGGRGRVTIDLTPENFEELQGILKRLGELDGKDFKFIKL